MEGKWDTSSCGLTDACGFLAGVLVWHVRDFHIWGQVMPWIFLLFALFAVLDSNGVDVHVFRLALFSVNGLYLLLEVEIGFIIFTETVVNVTGDSVSISGVSSAVVSVFLLFLVFVDVIERLF